MTLTLEKFFSNKHYFIDQPNANTIHTKPIPSAGGISILISYLIFIFSIVHYAFADYSIFLILLYCPAILLVDLILMDCFNRNISVVSMG